MATNRKLGRTTDIRVSMLKNLTTDVIMYGKVETTLDRAKEVKSIVDSIISLAIKEKDNFETVDVKIIKAKEYNPYDIESYALEILRKEVDKYGK